MGNLTGVVKHKKVRGAGNSNIVLLTFSNSYATGGDTLPISVLGIGKRVSYISPPGHTSPSGHAVEVIYGATEFTAPKLRLRLATSGAEQTNAVDMSGETILVEAFADPYK
jgi:hypothetical protein